MKRIVQPELLDTLPPDDPRAVRSRRDLRRVNAWMRHHTILARVLEKNLDGRPFAHFTELGAGDGNFLLRVAQKLQAGSASRHSGSSGNSVTLLDLKQNVSAETGAAFARLGWRAESVLADVFDWPPAACEVVVANLFLHHFEGARLAELLRLISLRASLLVALEPCRGWWPLFCSRLLWIIGCNNVTLHDAAVSVQAGFRGQELSTLWPDPVNWQLTEQRTGPFSHLFVARKIS